MNNPFAGLAKKMPDHDTVRAYQLKFPADDMSGQIILGDLAVFCGIFETTAKPTAQGQIDPVAMGIAEGRRQVLMRITAMLNMDQSPLWRLAQQHLERNNG